ncbi:response regulator [Cellulophaga baltica]|uniref:Transcriptional regulator n=1 Tax=Cellulophaga baltica 18 TaxID=1348584 RepID=A0AAU8S7E7_9FLAO|nr:response regulator [Cellulophaga baltica]AIZ43654.1 transcriptional regulator [Cellulophaga baltica 18]WFO15263.1 response regulator [Cellulophaga baltica 4]
MIEYVENACVIDDDPISVFGLKKTIRETKFCKEIIVYENGFEAINGLKDLLNTNGNIPPIIFLDLNMPIMDGWDFLEDFIKIPEENRNNVRIYIVSSSVDPRDLIKAKSYSEVNNFFVKPVTTNDLQKVIDEISQ